MQNRSVRKLSIKLQPLPRNYATDSREELSLEPADPLIRSSEQQHNNTVGHPPVDQTDSFLNAQNSRSSQQTTTCVQR